jgi:hypothetical protein
VQACAVNDFAESRQFFRDDKRRDVALAQSPVCFRRKCDASMRNSQARCPSMRVARFVTTLTDDGVGCASRCGAPARRARKRALFVGATLDPDDRALSRDNGAFAEHDRKLGIAWPTTLAVINRRQGSAVPGVVAVEKKEDLWPLVSRLASDGDLVLKPAYGERGRGFFLVARDAGVRDGRGRHVSPSELADAIFRYRHRLGSYGYLAQPALVSHPEVVRLTGIEGLVTARIVTAVSNGRPPIIVESSVKIPGPGSRTDNFLSGVTGTVMAGFDCETGRLTEVVGLLRDWGAATRSRMGPCTPPRGEASRGRRCHCGEMRRGHRLPSGDGSPTNGSLGVGRRAHAVGMRGSRRQPELGVGTTAVCERGASAATDGALSGAFPLSRPCVTRAE